MAYLHLQLFVIYIESLDKALLHLPEHDTKTCLHPSNKALCHSFEISPGMDYESCNFSMPIAAIKKHHADSIGEDLQKIRNK